MKSALYRPRCRPDGDVVVVSRQDLILPANSCSVISAGSMSRSEATLHVVNSAWH